MPRRIAPSCLVFTCLVLLAFHVRAAAPVDAYGSMPSIEQARLSPNGSTIAFIQTTQDWRVLAIVALDPMKVISLARVGDQKVRSIDWADDDHLLLTSASSVLPMGLIGERSEWHLMKVFNLKTQKWKALLDHVQGDTNTMNTVYGRPVIHHEHNETFLYVHGTYVEDQTEAALFRINLTTGKEIRSSSPSPKPTASS